MANSMLEATGFNPEEESDKQQALLDEQAVQTQQSDTLEAMEPAMAARDLEIQQGIASGAIPLTDGLGNNLTPEQFDAGAGVETGEVTQASMDPAQDPSSFVQPDVAPPVEDKSSPFDEGFNQMQEGNRQLQSAVDQNTAENLAIQEEAAMQKKGLADMQMEEEKKRQDSVAVLDSEIEDLHKDIRESKIEPDRLWNNKSTGQKIGAAIAVMLGGVSAGLIGGENAALGIIQAGIDRDIDAQKQGVMNLKDLESKKGNMYSMLLAKHKDARMAEAGVRAAMLEDVQTKVKNLAAKTGNAAVRAKAETANGEIEIQKQKQIQAMRDIKMTLMEGQALPEDVSFTKLNKDQQKKFIPEFRQVISGTPKEASDFKAMISASSDVDRLTGNLLSFSESVGSKFTVADRAKAHVLVTQLRAALRIPILGPGTVQERESDLLKSIAVDPTKIFSLTAANIVKLETLQKSVRDAVISRGKSLGIKDKTPKSLKKR